MTAVLAKMFLFGNKKKKAPVALQDPAVKYPLKLIDREVSTGCGMGKGVVYYCSGCIIAALSARI